MGKYLNRDQITVDAVITKLGREKLAEGRGQFQIIKYALSDDEVDYEMWDPANTNGTSYYGRAIEDMSITEANPNETETMRHKLISLPKNSQRLPSISLAGGVTSFTIDSNLLNPLTLKPVTFNPIGGNQNLGYTAIIDSGAILKIEGGGANAGGGTSYLQGIGISTDIAGKTITATGTQFNILPVPQYNENKTTQLLITGNETGGMIIVTITINKATVNVPTI